MGKNNKREFKSDSIKGWGGISNEEETVHELLPENQILKFIRNGSNIEVPKEVESFSEEGKRNYINWKKL